MSDGTNLESALKYLEHLVEWEVVDPSNRLQTEAHKALSAIRSYMRVLEAIARSSHDLAHYLKNEVESHDLKVHDVVRFELETVLQLFEDYIDEDMRAQLYRPSKHTPRHIRKKQLEEWADKKAETS